MDDCSGNDSTTLVPGTLLTAMDTGGPVTVSIEVADTFGVIAAMEVTDSISAAIFKSCSAVLVWSWLRGPLEAVIWRKKNRF